MKETPHESCDCFQVSLLQLVLVTLTVGTIVWLNVEFDSVDPGSTHRASGWPLACYIHDPYVPPEYEVVEVPAAAGSAGAPEAVVIRRHRWSGDAPLRGLQPGMLLLDMLFWAAFLVLAWVVGDHSSLPRSVRGRLRKVKRCARDGVAPGRD